jgi:undecaprenyl-diphosphatase
MTLLHILHVLILAVVQGLAELLPVSSSAHVIVVAKLLGLDPSKPDITLLVVMLHTGTMFAVIIYFWKAWKNSLFASREVFIEQATRLVLATLLTIVIGWPLIKGIEKGMEMSGYLAKDASGHVPKAEIELLFKNLPLVACALTAGGILILIAGLRKPTGHPPAEKRVAAAADTLTVGGVLNRTTRQSRRVKVGDGSIGIREAAWMGAVQGLCLPFRGFSRSGATISTGMLLGAVKARVEEFSFAMAVVITPMVVGHEVSRLIEAQREAGASGVTWGDFAPSLLGMVFAMLAGLLALRWLSRWLEAGRWYLFGIYCLLAAVGVFTLAVLRY